MSDDKTIRCWDLTQECKCVRTIEGVHGHFVSALRWAPSIYKDGDAVNGHVNGASMNGNSVGKQSEAEKASIRCVIATGSVDQNVRIFAS